MMVLGVVLAAVGAGEAYASGAVGASSASGAASTHGTGATSTITPADAGSALTPGATATITVTVHNAADAPARVVAFGPARSAATATCPAGTVTSAPVIAPARTVPAGGDADYPLTVRMAGDAANGCQGVAMRLPVTAVLVPSP